jgi:succinate dehydrogenase/fumarate reductase flavoprotein subunit
VRETVQPMKSSYHVDPHAGKPNVQIMADHLPEPHSEIQMNLKISTNIIPKTTKLTPTAEIMPVLISVHTVRQFVSDGANVKKVL